MSAALLYPDRLHTVLVAAVRGVPVGPAFEAAVAELDARGFVDARSETEGGTVVRLSPEGLDAARHQNALAWWLLWRSAYESLLDRGSVETDAVRRRVLLSRGHSALERARDAFRRAFPESRSL